MNLVDWALSIWSRFDWIIQTIVIVLLIFSIGNLLRLVALLLEFLVERILPTKLYYWLMVSIIVFLILCQPTLNTDVELNWLAMISILVASGLAYFRLREDTGCPHCKSFLPFRRREIIRHKQRIEQKRSRNIECYSSPYFSFRKPYFRLEHSWDETVVRVYQIDLVRYRCINCDHGWETNETKMLSKYEEHQDLPPETHRPHGTA